MKSLKKQMSKKNAFSSRKNKKTKKNVKNKSRKNKINNMRGGAKLNETLLNRIRDNDPTLTELFFNDEHNNLKHDSLIALANALKLNKTVIKLIFSETTFSDNVVKALANTLKINKTLIILILSDNKLNNQNAIDIAHALPYNSTLITLDISDNNINDEGIIPIAEALKKNSTLTTLNIDLNNFGIGSISALSELLKLNKTLTRLKMDNYLDYDMYNDDEKKYIDSINDLILRNIKLVLESHITICGQGKNTLNNILSNLELRFPTIERNDFIKIVEPQTALLCAAGMSNPRNSLRALNRVYKTYGIPYHEIIKETYYPWIIDDYM